MVFLLFNFFGFLDVQIVGGAVVIANFTEKISLLIALLNSISRVFSFEKIYFALAPLSFSKYAQVSVISFLVGFDFLKAPKTPWYNKLLVEDETFEKYLPDNSGFIPNGKSTIELGDTVIIVTTNKGLYDIENILSLKPIHPDTV